MFANDIACADEDETSVRADPKCAVLRVAKQTRCLRREPVIVCAVCAAPNPVAQHRLGISQNDFVPRAVLESSRAALFRGAPINAAEQGHVDIR